MTDAVVEPVMETSGGLRDQGDAPGHTVSFHPLILMTHRYLSLALAAALLAPLGAAQNRAGSATAATPTTTPDDKSQVISRTPARISTTPEVKPAAVAPTGALSTEVKARSASILQVVPATKGGTSATFSGTTTDRPVFTRQDCNPDNPTDPDAECTDEGQRQWEEHALRVSESGTYTITTEWESFDGYLHLYEGDFVPSEPRARLIATNDDFGSTAASQITIDLVANQTYTIIATGFGSTSAGDYAGQVATALASRIEVVTEAEPAFDIVTGTTGQGTFQRPSCSTPYPTSPTNDCSLRETPVSYATVQVMTFNDALYQIRSTQTDADGFFHVYAGGFDPENPLDNLIASVDDDYGIQSTEATLFLNAGELQEDNASEVGFYTVVANNFSSAGDNAFTLEFRPTRISGVGLAFNDGAVFQDLDEAEITGSEPTMARVRCGVPSPGDPSADCTLGDPRPYHVTQFTPSGEELVVPLTQTQQFDGIMTVYAGAFDPSAPLDNLAANNDDGSAGVGTSDVYLTLSPGTTYFVVTQPFSASGAGRFVTAAHTFQDRMDIEFSMFVSDEEDARAGEALAFAPVAPNPASRSARVTLTTPAAGDVHVAVYDALGREVAVIADGAAAAGPQTYELDARALAAGVYVVRARTADGVAAQTLTVAR